MRSRKGFVAWVLAVTLIVDGYVQAGWSVISPGADPMSTTSNFNARGTGEPQQTADVVFCRHDGVVECGRSATVADEPEEWLIDGSNRFEPTPAWSVDPEGKKHRLKVYCYAISMNELATHDFAIVN